MLHAFAVLRKGIGSLPTEKYDCSILVLDVTIQRQNLQKRRSTVVWQSLSPLQVSLGLPLANIIPGFNISDHNALFEAVGGKLEEIEALA